MTADETELPRGIALAWGVAANPQRGPKREMSVERIVETAVALADADGIGAVSMAAVAAKLGFTPMSLYRYVSAKDDLLLLMQEQATGLPPEAHRDHDTWQAKMTALFEAQVLVYLEHPWILSLPITGAPITPSSSAWLDAALAVLEGTPLSDTERLATALSVMGQSRWYGIVLAGYAEQARLTGLSPEDVSAREAALFDRVITDEEFPALRHAIDAGVFTDEGDPFRFGLQRILDGVATYIDRRENGEPAEAEAAWVEGEAEQVLADKRVRESRKAVRDAEKALRTARKEERVALRDARARVTRDAPK
ncbi:TetR/AcrR family transcriptional regulator [Microbacterium sp. H1-D42]|uniref:TetR/AcrR family transcriptional regulator n=1 Tax=Microbacterium sp. H1-D42 TaxID=2925844 RepID=UPI001F52DC0A|nr:TetR/AcrR family transcriptional regulator [Microbacterium sp. H1-D42]UNK70239.1 TetR/AcrR family transcriptional regulator [Microbacterium sp. H1-D42]